MSSQHRAGKRACDLLEVKRAHFKVLDLNKDCWQVSTHRKSERFALESLEGRDDLAFNVDGSVAVPQVFVDGQRVGDLDDLQELEDDGLLEEVLQNLRRGLLDGALDCGSTTVAAGPPPQTP